MSQTEIAVGEENEISHKEIDQNQNESVKDVTIAQSSENGDPKQESEHSEWVRAELECDNDPATDVVDRGAPVGNNRAPEVNSINQSSETNNSDKTPEIKNINGASELTKNEASAMIIVNEAPGMISSDINQNKSRNGHDEEK